MSYLWWPWTTMTFQYVTRPTVPKSASSWTAVTVSNPPTSSWSGSSSKRSWIVLISAQPRSALERSSTGKVFNRPEQNGRHLQKKISCFTFWIKFYDEQFDIRASTVRFGMVPVRKNFWCLSWWIRLTSHKIYFRFHFSFLSIGTTLVIEIMTHGKPGPIYPM